MKQLPYACRKGHLKVKLNGYTEKYLNELIYGAVQKCRNCTLEAAKSIRILSKKEVTMVMEALGELEPAESSFTE